MENEKQVDESWKEEVAKERSQPETATEQDSSEVEVNFTGYVTSLAFQAMIFLGEIPNPLTNEMDKNVRQAKFLIDTLALLKEKTAGNLNKEEEDLLNASVYELQLKYVEALNNPESAEQGD